MPKDINMIHLTHFLTENKNIFHMSHIIKEWRGRMWQGVINHFQM